MGSFASAVFVYGASLVYGTTGELDLREIGAALDPENPVALLGAGLLVSALGFKIASAPFHQWAPDVYQGAPTTVTGFMAAAAKITAFAALIRVSVLMLQPALDLFYPIIWVLAFLSMSVGNLMALMQRNLKRLLAFSGVAHAGYLLVGILVGGPDGLAAVLFYLLAYVFMTVGAFTVIATLAREGQERDTLDDLVGLVHTQPFIAISMTVCAFSLLGLPGTAGFIAKFQVFAAAISRALTTGDGWLVTLVVIALLNTCISIVYYLRIPSLMFMQRPLADSDPGPPGTLERAVLLTCALACVILGLAPHDALPGLYQLDLLRLAELAAASLN
jgi:NADH-quinone oxidoreductase subunit N